MEQIYPDGSSRRRTLKQSFQKKAGIGVNTGLGACSRTCNIEGFNGVLFYPEANGYQGPLIIKAGNKEGAFLQQGALAGITAAALKASAHKNQGAFGVADIPGGSLLVTCTRGFIKMVALRYGAILRPSPLRAPPAVFKTKAYGYIQSGPVNTALAT